MSRVFHHSSLFLNILPCPKKCLHSNLFNTDETLMKLTGPRKLRVGKVVGDLLILLLGDVLFDYLSVVCANLMSIKC
jgi:hypothetical protein